MADEAAPTTEKKKAVLMIVQVRRLRVRKFSLRRRGGGRAIVGIYAVDELAKKKKGRAKSLREKKKKAGLERIGRGRTKRAFRRRRGTWYWSDLLCPGMAVLLKATDEAEAITRF